MNGPHDWFQTPPGQHALAWERARLDAALADVFGYHALQLGLSELDALAANRMPDRWLAMDTPPAPPAEAGARPAMAARMALVTDPAALPFAEASLDLVVLPHTLDLSSDPHAALREVQRVLVYEGKVAITGFNPFSLWGFKQWRALQWRRLGWRGPLFLPEGGGPIGPRRLRDWLRLLQFEVEAVRFGCWRPALRSSGGLARFAWMDRLGARWWPIFGASYFVLAVKRAQGPKLVGAAWKAAPAVAGAPAPVAHRTASNEKKPIEQN